MSDINIVELLPPLSEEEYEALKADIAMRGVQVPIEVDDEGNILDGFHRAKACRELGKDEPVQFQRFGMTEKEKVYHALSLNIKRRKMTEEQRNELIVRLAEQKVLDENSKEKPMWSQEEIASAVGITRERIAQILKSYPHVNTNMWTTSENGERIPAAGRPYSLTFPVRKAIMRRNKRERSRVAKPPAVLLEDGEDVLTVSERNAIANRQQAQKRRADRQAQTKTQYWKDVSLACGDFRELGANIADQSIHLILTDPPYGREYVCLWADLAQLAKRILVPGGFLVAYSGQFTFPEAFNSLAATLNYFWLGYLLMPGPAATYPKHFHNRGKPVLFFTAGKPREHLLTEDVFTSLAVEKEEHDWQQSIHPALIIIEAFSQPDESVLDPMMGSGTFIIAASRLNRKATGYDLEQTCIDACHARLTKEIANGTGT